MIENWYSKLCVAVRWIDAISGFFNVMTGVRQGSILSPRLFTVLINIIVKKLSSLQCLLRTTSAISQVF